MRLSQSRSRPRARGLPPRPRRGMSLVELMVAVFVLSVGLLALAGVGATVGRQVNSAGLSTNASLIVQSRVDSLSSISCANLTALEGTTRTNTPMNGITEEWLVTDGDNVKTVSVTVRLRGHVNPIVYSTVIPCRNT